MRDGKEGFDRRRRRIKLIEEVKNRNKNVKHWEPEKWVLNGRKRRYWERKRETKKQENENEKKEIEGRYCGKKIERRYREKKKLRIEKEETEIKGRRGD